MNLFLSSLLNNFFLLIRTFNIKFSSWKNGLSLVHVSGLPGELPSFRYKSWYLSQLTTARCWVNDTISMRERAITTLSNPALWIFNFHSKTANFTELFAANDARELNTKFSFPILFCASSSSLTSLSHSYLSSRIPPNNPCLFELAHRKTTFIRNAAPEQLEKKKCQTNS